MTDRIRCIVPFCRRTAPRAGRFAGDDEFICGKHWLLVDRRLKRLYRRVRARARCLNDFRSMRATARVWWRCKRQAIERAGGLV